MQSDSFKLPLEISYKSLENIHGVKFTPREIDVVACIISGRAATKTIASFLSIESKTVEVHTRNIRLKLECNSRESIVHFIEKAGKFSSARQHYLFLLIQAAFEQKLQQVSSLVIQKNLSCLIVYEKQYELFIEQLKKYFKRLGIEGVFRIKEADKSLKDSFQDLDSHSSAHCLFVTSSLHLKQLLIKESLEDATLSQFLQNSEAITFVSLGEESEEMSQEMHEIDSMAHIRFGNSERYYLSFFDLLKRLFPDVALDTLISGFKEQYEILTTDPSGKTSLALASEGRDLEPKEQISDHLFFNFLKKRPGKLLISGILCLSVFCTLILAFKSNKPTQIPPLHQVQKSKAIRSDLPLPHDNVLLKRPEMMKHIEEKLKGNQGIQTVALVGIGGAGKTTAARHYAHQQNADVIWEMNAETKGSLISSFENLAYALAKTEDEKKILRGLQEIKDSKERIEKILSFTKERLKTYPNWFLVYDNVEKFSEIQKYFPTDTKVWGRGKIILTTRDSNIANNSYIHHAFPIGELSEGEKLSLFMNILSHGNAHPLTSVQKEQAQKFLTKIPPFPLDISAAAHYLRATNISYQEYLEHLRQHDEDFDNTQQNILKEANEYDKTRQKIIRLSLENLVKINKDFEELLLLISLIDSQNILRDLLNAYKNNSVVDNFIFHLKKYSFVTNESLVQSIKTFSIHRSTQEIILTHFTNTLNLRKNKKLLQPIASTLENYLTDIIDKEDFSKMTLLFSHCKVLLNHNNLLTDTSKGVIGGILGSIIFYLGNYDKAKQFLKESLVILKKYDTENHIKIAHILLYLGNVYRNLGDYEKAKSLLEQSLIIYKKQFLGNYVGIARILAYLGDIYTNLGDYEKAKSLLEQSLTIYKKQFPENHIGVAQALGYLGNVYSILGDYEKSKDLLEESLLINRQYFSENHVGIARALGYLGNIYRNIGDYKKSKNLLEESLLIYKKQFLKNHVYVAWALGNLGIVYRNLGDYEKSKDLLEENLLINRQYFSENHIYVGWVLVHLGNVYRESGDYKKAKNLLEEGLLIYKKFYPENHVYVTWILVSLGNIYRELGNYEKARSLLEQSLIIYKKHFSDKHAKVAWILVSLGNIYRELGNYGKAKSLLKQSLIIYEKSYGKNHIKTARILQYLGQTSLLESQLETAENLIKKSLDVFQQNKHPESYMCLESLAELYCRKSIEAMNKGSKQECEDLKKQAINYLNEALKIVEIHFPKNSPHFQRIKDKCIKLTT